MVEASRAAGVPVLAGGPGFGPDGRWATAIGAAGWGASARDAVELLERPLFAAHTGAPPPPPDDAYVAVLHRRRELVRLALAAVDPPPESAEDVAAGIAHLVDALIAAVRVDDDRLLRDFVGWQEEALTSRGGRALLTGCSTRWNGRSPSIPGWWPGCGPPAKPLPGDPGPAG
ncbi:hypothetical protein V2I01_06080 [Micromonospora sp. BRA006-A]|nr:hypothetical protein [Micromonospora sp. BRA006-A]